MSDNLYNNYDDQNDWNGPVIEDEVYTKVIRDWGYYQILYGCSTFVVKKLYIESGKSTSYQLHKGRSECHKIISGHGTYKTAPRKPMNIGDLEYVKPYKAGDVLIFDIGEPHQLSAIESTTICEIWTGPLLDENDIERL